MAAEKNFFDVLEDQIRRDLRIEIEAELRREMGIAAGSEAPPSPAAAASSRLETWLAANIHKAFFRPGKAAAAAYKSQAAGRTEPARESAQTPLEQSEVRFMISEPEEIFAAELLRRYSKIELGTQIAPSELKLAWRRAALKTHPDRYAQADAVTQARAGALFQELASAYELLNAKCEAIRAA